MFFEKVLHAPLQILIYTLQCYTRSKYDHTTCFPISLALRCPPAFLRAFVEQKTLKAGDPQVMRFRPLQVLNSAA